MRGLLLISLICFIASASDLLAEEVEQVELAVKVVTLENFDDLVKNSQQDVLLDFYAPWCGHCKTLEPIYEKFAQSIAGNLNIIIAKVDATVHKIPGVTIKGYPTLKFFKKGATPEIVDYSGPRSIDGFVDFIKKNTSYKTAEEALQTEEAIKVVRSDDL